MPLSSFYFQGQTGEARSCGSQPLNWNNHITFQPSQSKSCLFLFKPGGRDTLNSQGLPLSGRFRNSYVPGAEQPTPRKVK